MSLPTQSLALVRRAVGAEVFSWLERALPEHDPVAPFSRGVFFGFFAGTGRRTAGAVLTLRDDERASLVALGVPAPERWSVADFARYALLSRALEATAPETHAALVHEAFRKGDNDERIATLRALAYLPSPERFAPTAFEAARTHVVDVFVALACDNSYPARHFPELHWNQLVMKALFVEAPVARMIGIAERRNDELARMARDFVAERTAAGRPVPVEIGLVDPTLQTTASTPFP
jgi:hypothetical protein